MSNYGYQSNISPANVSPAKTAPVAGYGGYGGFGNTGAGAIGGVMGQQGFMMQQAMPMPPNVASGGFVTPSGANVPTTLPAFEESYLENILRLNRGKMATFYMTYENNREWNAKVFKGIIEAAGRDHIIISDPATGMRFLLLTLNLDYVTFTEPINYEYPFQGGVVTNTSPVANTR